MINRILFGGAAKEFLLAAPKILVLEDTDTSIPGLQGKLHAVGYSVIGQFLATPDSFTEAAKSMPDLALVTLMLPVSRTAVDLGNRLQSELHIPVVFLAGSAGQNLLQRCGVTDPFSILRWPTDESALRSHLAMVLQRRTLENQLRDSQENLRGISRYRSLFENSPVSLWEEDFSEVKRSIDTIQQQGFQDVRDYFRKYPEAIQKITKLVKILDVNRATVKLFRAHSKNDLLGEPDRIIHPAQSNIMLEEFVCIAEGKTEFEGLGVNYDLEDNLLDIRLVWSVSPGAEKDYSNVIVSVTDITQQKHREDVLKVIASVSTALRGAQTRAEILPIVLRQVAEHIQVSSSALSFLNSDGNRATVELAYGEWTLATGWNINQEVKDTFQNVEQGKPYINPDVRTDSQFPFFKLTKKDISISATPLMVQNRCIGILWAGRETPLTASENELIIAIAEIVATAIFRTTLNEQTRHYADQVTTVGSIGRALSTTLDLQEIYDQIARGIFDLLPDIAGIYISTYDNQRMLISYEYGIRDGERLDFKKVPPIPLDSPEVGSQGDVIRSGQPLIINDLQARRRQVQTGILVGSPAIKTQSGIYVPMLAKNEILGVVFAQSYIPNRFTQADAHLLTLMANTSAIAIQNARLFAATQRRVERLTALHAIDVVISSSLDLRVIFSILMDQLIALLHLDAADILLYDNASQKLEYVSGRGFRSATMSRTQLKLSEGLAGRAAMENHIVTVSNFQGAEINDRRVNFMSAEDFIAYSAVPLISKGQVKGVLEVFYRSSPDLDSEWQEFLEILAGQVAVAIDNSILFNQLQRTNMDLTLAYDTTLEGWSRALDLRDRDTEIHTRHVTEMSVQLARLMGLSDAEVIQIRRGALLHDIGKLGIPDRILGKTGPLLEEERDIMKKHPAYALDMLKDIDFLAPARVIPYCHHEKWDGSGYPRGLKGEQIPLGARIFAVVDVWDSLCSNRPYREAWPIEKANDYIRSHAGSHFDPQVVKAFLKLISTSNQT
jgi:HD-GYP domain-containing protein (c-di-GMP phosphodiesterase class II)/PAS domain-containing protein